MLLPNYSEKGTVRGKGTGTESSSGQGLMDHTGKKEKEAEGEKISGNNGGDRERCSGGGVARDVGTYKALIPILEAASSISATSSRSMDSIEQARTTLESVRRTGSIEGLIH